MVDLVHNAVLVGGLDFWGWDKKKGRVPVPEPRLRDTLADRFKKAGLALSADYPFFEPPVAGDEASRFVGVQVLESPQWFVCQNPACRALVRKDGLELKNGKYLHVCGSDRKPHETVPVRFLGACKKGHTQDFPKRMPHIDPSAGARRRATICSTRSRTSRSPSRARLDRTGGADQLVARHLDRRPPALRERARVRDRGWLQLRSRRRDLPTPSRGHA